ncbi:MAG: DUF2871 domain-containing protein [Microbacteriaceae bacterium]|nr:DUF2871 domain-containing protein [Cryobacterium sp.]MBX3103782.1 DUF2871 domain-containing protein [Cryobacterium sp.]MCC7128494.1 DUF2871 domain-containing protein [Microbacteriaceae bacterium]
MKKLFYASFAYLVLGLAGGLFFREFTKAFDFSTTQFTQLAVVHTHLLVLGFTVMLIVLVLEKLFSLSNSRLFGWFFWVYNAGLVLSAGVMTWHGILQVTGGAISAGMVSGIAGLGHILLTIALVMLMFALGSRLRASAPKVDGSGA